MDQAQQIKKRLAELQNRGTFGGYTVYTGFLGLEEQSLLAEVTGPRSVPAYGGFDGAERVMAAFGPAPEPADYPITCLHIAPKQEKFAEELTHRDYLGTLMGLGLERRVTFSPAAREHISFAPQAWRSTLRPNCTGCATQR